jgi:mono/diheme cytochrome c family protein
MESATPVPDATRPDARTRTSALFALAGLGVLALAIGVSQRRARAETTPASRGAELAVSLGCTACHGPHGAGGIADPGSRDGVVPGWDGPTLATYARDEAELREWIVDGRPKRLAALGASRSTVPMPAFRDRLSDLELGDLLAYLRAVSAFGVELSETCHEGRKVAERLGCFSCHGPSGITKTPNPGSFKGYIPPWDGDEWAELVHDEAELREWILDGRPKRLAENALARHFLDGQAVKMPAYRAHLSDEDANRLVAYLLFLRKR